MCLQNKKQLNKLKLKRCIQLLSDILYIDRLVFLDFKLITNSNILRIWVLFLQGNSTALNKNFVQWHHFFGSAFFATIRVNYTTLCRVILRHLPHDVARRPSSLGHFHRRPTHTVCFLAYSSAGVAGIHPRNKQQLQSVFLVLISARILRFIGFPASYGELSPTNRRSSLGTVNLFVQTQGEYLLAPCTENSRAVEVFQHPQ